MDITADGFISLMDENGAVREDVKLPPWPESMARDIKDEFEKGGQLLCTVMSAMGTEQIISWKEEQP